MMRYSDKSLSLLVLLLVGLQRNSVNTQSETDPKAELYRKYLALNSNIGRGTQQSTPWNNQMSQPTSALYPQINGGASQVSGGALQQFDERVSNLISNHVLQFSHNVGVHLAESQYSKSEVFSPVSVMSALALLMLGAKGRSYQELRKVFGLDLDTELLSNPSKFHTELGYMLEDLESNSNTIHSRNRNTSEWRSTVVNHSMRNTNNNNNDANGNAMDHITKIANGIFVQTGYSLNPDYSSTLQSVYRSEVTQLDFARKEAEARDYINNWVSQSTFGKVPNILTGQIPSSTNVILASALYFKGLWENAFFELATAVDNFYPDGKNSAPIKVQMMATGGTFPYHDSVEHNCRIIGFPYKGNKTAMYIIQPNQSTRSKLRDFQRTLNAQKIEDLISKMTKRTAIVAFPKFHLIRSLNMRSILNQFGINDIFTSGVSDLSLINGGWDTTNTPPQTYAPVPTTNPNDRLVFTPNGSRQRRQSQQMQPIYARQTRESPLQRLEYQRPVVDKSKSELFVEEIVHKVDFDINEHGTEAAAATLTYLRRSGTDILFRAEEPFLFLVRDDPTKLILFYGFFNEPDN